MSILKNGEEEEEGNRNKKKRKMRKKDDREERKKWKILLTLGCFLQAGLPFRLRGSCLGC